MIVLSQELVISVIYYIFLAFMHLSLPLILSFVSGIMFCFGNDKQLDGWLNFITPILFVLSFILSFFTFGVIVIE